MNYDKIINRTRKNIFIYYDKSEDIGKKATKIINIAKRNKNIFDIKHINKNNKLHGIKQNNLLFRTS